MTDYILNLSEPIIDHEYSIGSATDCTMVHKERHSHRGIQSWNSRRQARIKMAKAILFQPPIFPYPRRAAQSREWGRSSPPIPLTARDPWAPRSPPPPDRGFKWTASYLGSFRLKKKCQRGCLPGRIAAECEYQGSHLYQYCQVKYAPYCLINFTWGP